MKVLIADDSSLIRERLKAALNEIPAIKHVAEAVSGEGAVALFRQFLPDVAILDVHMPPGTGIEALEIIKREAPGTTVLIFSDYSYPQYRQRCLKAGASHYLAKSTDFNQVTDIVRILTRATEATPDVC